MGNYNNGNCVLLKDCKSESGNVVVLLKYLNGHATFLRGNVAASSSYAPSTLNGLYVRKAMKTTRTKM